MIDPSPEPIAVELERMLLTVPSSMAAWLSRYANSVRDAIALLRLPRVPLAEEIIVDAYQKAKDLWGSQCFCFTSAPESLRRSAHEVARDGFQEIATCIGPLARPILDAEYREAAALAKAETESKSAQAKPGPFQQAAVKTDAGYVAGPLTAIVVACPTCGHAAHQMICHEPTSKGQAPCLCDTSTRIPVRDALAEEELDIRGDATVLRAHIRIHGETPAMTASSREYWKRKVERLTKQLEQDAEFIQNSMLTFGEVAGFINSWTIATPDSYAGRTPRERELYQLWVVLKRKIQEECAKAYEKDRS